MFYQLFLSPQVKRWAIIKYKHGIYELPHELANHLRLTILKQIFSLEKNMEACAPRAPICPPHPPQTRPRTPMMETPSKNNERLITVNHPREQSSP